MAGKAFLIQFAGSAAFVAVLAAVAALARISKPRSALTQERARALLADEFPGREFDAVWVSDDGCGAVARAGAQALILTEIGDGYVARDIPWDGALAARSNKGIVQFDLADIAAPRARLAFAVWPPGDTH